MFKEKHWQKRRSEANSVFPQRRPDDENNKYKATVVPN